jgi:ABC-type molybdenum transport system ATPase subunit/photorepair protein PhrA
MILSLAITLIFPATLIYRNHKSVGLNSISTNLLILDEIFDSSLDFMGTDYFTRIIKYVIKNTNIFVISHKTDELIDKFDRVIKFDKVKGFSKMVD